MKRSSPEAQCESAPNKRRSMVPPSPPQSQKLPSISTLTRDVDKRAHENPQLMTPRDSAGSWTGTSGMREWPRSLVDIFLVLIHLTSICLVDNFHQHYAISHLIYKPFTVSSQSTLHPYRAKSSIFCVFFATKFRCTKS